MILRMLAAAVLAIHGLIQLIGFVVPWKIAPAEGAGSGSVAEGGR